MFAGFKMSVSSGMMLYVPLPLYGGSSGGQSNGLYMAKSLMKTWKQTKEPTIMSATTHVCRLVYRVLCLGQALDHFMTAF